MQQRVEGGHDAGPEQEGPVVDGDERLADCAEGAGVGSGGAGDVLAERVDGHDGEDADEDHGGLQDPGGDEAERGAFAVAPGDRVEGDGGDDAAEAR